MILVVFNGVNYYENWIPYLRIFIKLERYKHKERKFMRNFEYEN